MDGAAIERCDPSGKVSERHVKSKKIIIFRVFLCVSWASGFVFNAIHNVLPNTPVENFIAMIDTVNEFNGR